MHVLESDLTKNLRMSDDTRWVRSSYVLNAPASETRDDRIVAVTS